jgi:hypothetical protein
LQGWGSNQACQDLLHSKLSDAVNILHSLGGVGGLISSVSGLGDLIGGSSLGSPYSVQNCTGWDKAIHYSVAHESFTQNRLRWATEDPVAHHYCSIMLSTQPSVFSPKLPALSERYSAPNRSSGELPWPTGATVILPPVVTPLVAARLAAVVNSPERERKWFCSARMITRLTVAPRSLARYRDSGRAIGVKMRLRKAHEAWKVTSLSAARATTKFVLSHADFERF